MDANRRLGTLPSTPVISPAASANPAGGFMSRLSRRKFVAAVGGTVAAVAVGSKMLEASAATNAAAPDAYAKQFLDLYNKIKSSSNGYFSPSGVPYHSVETLMVEAPDHGHETTSEAFSYWMWLEAV